MSKKKLSVLSFVSATLLFSAVVGAPANVMAALEECRFKDRLQCVLNCNVGAMGGLETTKKGILFEMEGCHGKCFDDVVKT